MCSIGNLYEVQKKSGKKIKYLYANGQRIAESWKLNAESERQIRYYHNDHLGGSNIVTDASGKVVQYLEYLPYGDINRNIQFSDTDTPYKFTGKELDSETGLYYYGARYYDPVLGRFISPDSIVQAPYDPQTLNRYAYCRNNPVKYIDPSGYEFMTAFYLYSVYVMSNPAEFQMDFDSLKISSAKFLEDKNFSNAMDVILDAAGLGAGPLISGMALKTTKKLAIEGIQALNKVDNVADVARLAGKVDKATELGKSALKNADEVGEGVIKVRHYTNDIGKEAVEQAGKLNRHTFVTKVDAFPKGTHAATIESKLGISSGRGKYHFDLNVKQSDLYVPGAKHGGEVTRSGVWQRRLNRSYEIE